MSGGKALVLGGGGVSGRAWEIGVLAGLAARGVNLSDADTLVGTSAGAVVASCVACGVDLGRLYDEQVHGDPPTEGRMAPSVLLRVGLLAGRYWRDSHRFRLAAAGLAARAASPPPEEQLGRIARLIPSTTWPDKRLLLATVDGRTGQGTVLTKACGLSLVDAVSASTAVPGTRPPAGWPGVALIDGAFRSFANVDLAEGCDPVVVIAPAIAGVGPVLSGHPHLAALRRTAKVTLITPDLASLLAMGPNPMSDRNRPGSARAGYVQGKTLADATGSLWRRG